MDEETNGASRDSPTPMSNRNVAKRSKTTIGDEIRDTLANVVVVVNALAERINTPEPLHILMNKVTTYNCNEIMPIYTFAGICACN